MSFGGQRKAVCNWNYCSTCRFKRTRYPNGTKCKLCYDAESGGWRKAGTKNAEKERERIAVFLVEQGYEALAELVRARAYL
jgi:hypothetical protein